MATINKLDTSKGKITVNFPFINDDGSDSKYIISANQIGWAGGKLNDISFDTTAELLEAIENSIESKKSEALGNITGVKVTNTNNTLSWGKAITVANINGDAIKITLPSNPDTDTKVTAVDKHYTAKEIATQALYKIKTDAAGHIISATKFDDFIEKSAVNNLKQQIADFKMYMLLLNASTTSSSSATPEPVTPTVTPKPVTPTVTPLLDTTTSSSSATPEPVTPTVTPKPVTPTVTPGKGTNGSNGGTSETQSVTVTATSTSVSPK